MSLAASGVMHRPPRRCMSNAVIVLKVRWQALQCAVCSPHHVLAHPLHPIMLLSNVSHFVRATLSPRAAPRARLQLPHTTEMSCSRMALPSALRRQASGEWSACKSVVAPQS